MLDATKFTLYGSPRGDAKLANLEATAHAVIARIVKYGVTGDELEGQEPLCPLADLRRRQAVPCGRGVWLATGGTVQDVEEWPDRIRKVTADQVTAVAARFHALDHSSTGYLLPEGELIVENQRCGVVAQARSPRRREGSAPRHAAGDTLLLAISFLILPALNA